MEKECHRCKIKHPLENFRPHKQSADGLQYWCQICRRDYQREKARNAGIKKKRLRDPRLLEQDLKECFECNQVLHLEKFSPASRGYGGVTFCCKKCLSKRAMRDKKSHAANVAKWRANNPDYLAKHASHMQNRRAKTLEQDTGKVTTAFMVSLYASEICTYCQKEIPRKNRTIDHVIPIKKGGLHDPENLVMACMSCNSSKGTLDVITFMEKLKKNV